MTKKTWTVRQAGGTNYKIINHENGKECVVDIINDEQRTYAFKNMEKIGFVKGERGEIYNEIYKKEEDKKPKKARGPDINAVEFAFEQKNLAPLSVKVLAKLTMKERGTATEILVERITEEKYIYTTRDDERSEMWIYHEGIYIPQAKTYIKEYCRRVLGEAYTTALANDVISKIEADSYIDQKDFFADGNPEEIATQDCLLNVVTKETSSFNPEKIFFNKIPVLYDKTKECPAIKKHFQEVLKNKEDLPVIQELFGFMLLKEYRYEKAFMFIGTGRNGKGKTIDLMKSFLGPENCASVPLQQFEDDNFAKGEVFKKMANLAGDLDTRALKHTGSLKTLTGRDLISAARKFLPRVHFVNYAKMVFAANQIPQTYDVSPAFFMRWIVLEFPFTFLAQNEIDDLAPEDQKNCKLRDPEIIKNMIKEEELSGLLNFALNGLERLIKQKDFSYSKSTAEVKKVWIRKSDSFAAFLMDCVEEEESRISKQEIRFAYAKYCQRHKLKMVSDKSLKHTLTTTYAVSEDRESIEGNRIYFWYGIKLVEEKTELEEWLDEKVQEELEIKKEDKKEEENVKEGELEVEEGYKPVYDVGG